MGGRVVCKITDTNLNHDLVCIRLISVCLSGSCRAVCFTVGLKAYHFARALHRCVCVCVCVCVRLHISVCPCLLACSDGSQQFPVYLAS